MQYRIREYRQKARLSQAELAHKADVSRATISGLENGHIKITTTGTLIKLATALGQKVQDIFLE